MGKKIKSKPKEPKKRKFVRKSTKHVGILCAKFTLIQGVLWFVLTLVGITCYITKCRYGKFGKLVTAVYMTSGQENCLLVKPLIFLIILVIYCILSVSWIIFSFILLKVLKNWNSVKDVKEAARGWIKITSIIIAFDLIIFVLFFIDVICLYNTPNYHLSLEYDEQKEIIKGLLTAMVANISSENKIVEKNIFLNRLFQSSRNITYTTTTKMPSALNPFLTKDNWKPVLFPISKKIQKPDVNFSGLFHLELQASTEEAIIEIITIDPKENENNTVSDAAIVPAVLSVIAIRGVVVWVANIILLRDFYERIKQLKERNSCIAFLQKLNCCKTGDDSYKKSKKAGKKAGKKAKGKRKKIPIKRPKSKVKKRKIRKKIK